MEQSIKNSLNLSTVKLGPIKDDKGMLTYLETPSKEDLMTYFPGRNYFREQFMCAKHLNPLRVPPLFKVCAVANGILPFLIDLFEDFSYLNGGELYSKYVNLKFWIYCIPLIYLNTALFNLALNFLFMAVIDMKRRMSCMELCEANLECNRFKVKEKNKGPPLLNYIDPRTLLSWVDARVMYLDMG